MDICGICVCVCEGQLDPAGVPGASRPGFHGWRAPVTTVGTPLAVELDIEHSPLGTQPHHHQTALGHCPGPCSYTSLSCAAMPIDLQTTGNAPLRAMAPST